MKFKIVADSSSDTLSLSGVDYSSAPLKIITNQKEYIDDENLNVEKMAEELSSYKGKSSTACPSPSDWLEKFGDAQYVFCVTITSGLSGSYNSACIAKADYEEKYPERKVFIIDSLSAGPALRLIIDKLAEYINEKFSFEAVCEKIMAYKEKLGTLFVLESMKNLANNGRVSPIAAKAAGLLGIRAIGKASEKGTIELLEKPRGSEKALKSVLSNMLKMNYCGGKVRINHCSNLAVAQQLKNMIISRFKEAKIDIGECRALCSFYAEMGGLIIGFEK